MVTTPRFGLSTVVGVLLVLGAATLARNWQPPVPDHVVRAVRPGEGPRLREYGGRPEDRLTWEWDGRHRPWYVVVLDPQFAEIARLGPTAVDATALTMPADVVQRLAIGSTYHWFVESADAGPKVRSRLGAFGVPPR